MYKKINNSKGFWPNSVHESVQFGDNCTIGLNCIIEDNVVIGDDCFIGHNCFIRPNSVIGNRSCLRSFCLIDPDVIIGDDFQMFPHATVGGRTIVEDRVYWGPYSLSTNADNIRYFRSEVEEEIIKPVHVKKGAMIMAGCMIKPGITIGINSVLGMGSVLTKDIPSDEVWYGNPAELKKEVNLADRAYIDDSPWPYSIIDYHDELNKSI